MTNILQSVHMTGTFSCKSMTGLSVTFLFTGLINGKYFLSYTTIICVYNYSHKFYSGQENFMLFKDRLICL